MKRILSLLLISFLLVFGSCTKDNNLPSDGQVNAARLKKELSAGVPLVSISVYAMSTGDFLFSGSSYTITDDGFIIVINPNNGQVEYNLAKLGAFKITGDILQLYFQ